MNFPDDENGDVLQRLHEDGADFTVPHTINYEVAFSEKKHASVFCELASAENYDVELVSDPEEYLCLCTKLQFLDYQVVENTEKLLSKLAQPLAGEVVGWGVYN